MSLWPLDSKSGHPRPAPCHYIRVAWKKQHTQFWKLSPIKTRIPLHTLESFSSLLRPEHAANKVARKACCQVGRSKGTTSKIARLAELVTSRKGQSVDNGKSQRDSYMSHVSILRRKKKVKRIAALLTNKRQPQKLQPYNRQNRHQYPPQRLNIQRQPKEPAVRRVDLPRPRLQALKHPLGIARRRIDFVPPPQPDESTASNILEVVKVAG